MFHDLDLDGCGTLNHVANHIQANISTSFNGVTFIFAVLLLRKDFPVSAEKSGF